MPLSELRAAAGRVAANIAQHSPGAVQGTLRPAWAAVNMPRPLALQMSPQVIAMASLDDLKVGQAAFGAGEVPQWTLR